MHEQIQNSKWISGIISQLSEIRCLLSVFFEAMDAAVYDSRTQAE